MANNMLESKANEIIIEALQMVANEESIRELAEDNDNDVSTLIRWQTAKAGTAGFISGLPGGLLAVPACMADISATLVTQVRMVAGIAYLRGYDIKGENTRCMILLCILGDSVVGPIVKKAATEVMSNAVEAYLRKHTTKQLFQTLVEKLGTKVVSQSAASSLRHFIPLFSGVISSGVDVASTRAIGALADRMFTPKKSAYAYSA